MASLAHDLGLHRHRRRHRRNLGGRARVGLGTVLLLEAETRWPITPRAGPPRSTRPITATPSPIALNKASRADHDTLDGGLPVAARPHAAGGPGEEATAEADIDTMALTPISPEEARARVPIIDPEHVTRAGFHEAAWDIDTDRMVQHFARTIRSTGASVHAVQPVTAIARDGGQLERHGIGRETHSARVILNAAGAWADGIARMAGVDAAGPDGRCAGPSRACRARRP
jgi:D-arginine dehydrogenase